MSAKVKEINKEENTPQNLRKISLAEAREICKSPGVMVLWRPENLPEIEQYCLTNVP